MASMLVVAGHSATGAWWSASAGDHPTGTLAVLTTDAGARHLCSAETEARLRHADTCYNVTTTTSSRGSELSSASSRVQGCSHPRRRVAS